MELPASTAENAASGSCRAAAQHQSFFSVMLFIIAVFIVFTTTFNHVTRQRTAHLHGYGDDPSDIRLSYSPNNLSAFDILTLVLDVILKYIPGRTPALRTVLDEFRLPHMSLAGKFSISNKDYERFQRSRNNEHYVNTRKDITNPFFVFSLLSPLFVIVLSHKDCPIKPFGAVNTRSCIHFVDLSLCRDGPALIAASKASELVYTAEMGGKALSGRRKRRGVEFDITVEVWRKDSLILSATCSFLQFLSKSTKPLFKGDEKHEEVTWEPRSVQDRIRVAVPAHAPSQWAACSKDYNPIHVSTLGAKLFGFRSVIAHGSHVLTLFVEAVLRAGENRIENLLWSARDNIVLEATFVKPVTPLPMDLELHEGHRMGDSRLAYGLFKKDKPCVTGLVYSVEPPNCLE